MKFSFLGNMVFMICPYSLWIVIFVCISILRQLNCVSFIDTLCNTIGSSPTSLVGFFQTNLEFQNQLLSAACTCEGCAQLQSRIKRALNYDFFPTQIKFRFSEGRSLCYRSRFGIFSTSILSQQ